MGLDLRTVVLLTALAALLMGVAMRLTARSYPDHTDGVRSWAWACFAQSLGWGLLSLRDRIPEFWPVVVGNALVVLSVVLFYQAVKEFRGEPVRKIVPYSLVPASAVGFAFFLYVTPSVAARLVIVSAATAALAFACGVTLVADRKPKPLSHWVTGLGFLTGFGAILARAGYLLAVGPSLAAELTPDPVQKVTYTLNYVAVVTMTFGFVLMRTDRFNTEMIRLATIDSLTGCLNRAATERAVRREIDRADRYGLPLSLVVLDLDHFKAVNDTYGHQAGDAALRTVAGVLRTQVRASDVVGRYGGEEFLILLTNTPTEQAAAAAERIRTSVEATSVETRDQILRLTASLGVAGHDGGDDESLLRRADAALYEAKARGRNCVASDSGADSRPADRLASLAGA